MSKRLASCVRSMVALSCITGLACAGEIRSPNGKLSVGFRITDLPGQEGTLVYSVHFAVNESDKIVDQSGVIHGYALCDLLESTR